ncbi:reverse transcriptase domain-containing protein [Tanacetum coccineum]
MLRDIDETFRTLRKINMKLNPKKCTFGAVEGMFLGYMISPEGIKPCPDKTEAVLRLPSPRTIKEVQSLNGKLASMNRFLSKSAEKSLPLFKTLKKCIKKSDFHWTPEAEQAFKQLKQHLSELPMLVAPKPMEELIVYMSASHEAISEVLMTERNTVQTPVYFVSRALQGPELNYTLMEKLVLALVFAAKRLRRYFQAHATAVITDQPIKQIISRPDVAGRLQKWSVMLGEHNITYRPRTSVKGQILADFLIEKPDEAPPDTSVVETSQEPWILFHVGKSCGDNQRQSGKEVHVGQHSVPLRPSGRDSLGQRNQASLGGTGEKESNRRILPCPLGPIVLMIKSSHGDTPFSLTYGTEAVIPAKVVMPTYRTVVVDAVHNEMRGAKLK